MAILLSQKRYNFQIHFLDSSGLKLPYTDSLSSEVEATSQLTQMPSDFSIPLSLLVQFGEDEDGSVAKAVQKLLEEPEFTVVIQTMNTSGKVTKTMAVKEAWITSVAHGNLDTSSKESLSTIIEIGYAADHVMVSF